MLKGIDPLLTPDLLKVLAQMGHGDDIVVADANFTATSLAAGKPVIHLAGAGTLRAVQAILSLLPLDEQVPHPVAYMHVSGSPAGQVSGLQQAVIDHLEGQGLARPAQCEALERFAFYGRVREAFAIVHTSEMQPYANFLFKKGVIAEPLR